MADPLIPNAGRAASRFTLRHAIAVALGVLVIVVMLLTSGQMADLRVALPPLSNALNWLDAVPGPFDMYHVVFFALVAAGLRVMLPSVSGWALLALLGSLAVGTELLQFATVGRTPKLLDVRDDMIGAGIGLLLGSLPRWCRGSARQLEYLSLWLLLGGIAMLPIQQWPLASVLGFPVLASDALFVLALAGRGFALATGDAPVRLSGFHVWLALYLLAMLLAVLVLPPVRTGTSGNDFTCPLPSPSFAQAVAKWIGIAWLAAIAALACDAMERGWGRRVLAAWLVAAVLASLAALLATAGFYAGDSGHAAVSPLLSHYGSLPPGPYPRVSGLFANANMAGLFLLLTAGAALMARDAAWITRRQLQALLVLMAVPLLVTASQAVGAVVLLLAWWWWRRGEAPRGLRGAALGVAAVLAAANIGLLFVNPAAPFVAPSVRMQLWHQAWVTWQTSFWRGTGLGQPAASLDYLAPDGEWQHLGDAHNIALNLGAQGGALSITAFFGLVAWVWWRTRSHACLWGARAALMLAVAYLGIGGSFEDARVLWCFIGLLAGAGIACRTSESPRASRT